tara:strand:+ start:276 stop:506 length:231 start_codon:yes stop_codon:yes gene_type:complete
MITKGFEKTNVDIATPNDVSSFEKPLIADPAKLQRVDINVLKAKLEKTERKEFKKNIYILSTLITGLGIIGIYLSL